MWARPIPNFFGGSPHCGTTPPGGEFFARYDPFVRDRCSVYGLDSASVDELCQRVWVELARRMPSYQYDPGGSFRGWLRRLCHHRAIDLLRERQDHRFEALNGEELIDGQWPGDGIDEGRTMARSRPGGSCCSGRRSRSRRKSGARSSQSAGRSFWRVVIEGQSVSEAAAALGLKYATVYAGVNHVAKLLRDEGRRRKTHLGLDDSSHPAREG